MEIPYELEVVGEWRQNAATALRRHPNGTVFLMLERGRVHVCCLSGNRRGDLNWKAVRMTDWKAFSLEKLRGPVKVMVLKRKAARVKAVELREGGAL